MVREKSTPHSIGKAFGSGFMAPKHLSEVFGSSKHNSAPNSRRRESSPSTPTPEPQNSGRSPKRRASQAKFPDKLRFISLVAATYLLVTAGTFIVGSPFSNAQSVRQRATLSSTDSSTVFQLRSFPDGPISTYGRVGDSGEILDTHRGNDGYTWYYVRFPSTPRGAWVRADSVTLGNSASTGSSQTVTRPSPSTGVSSPPAASPSRPSQPETPIPSSVGGQPQGSPQYATTGPIGTPPSSTPVLQRPRFQRPSLTNPAATPAQPPRTTASVSTAPLNQETIDYFLEIALGSEWGNSSSTIRRWTQNLRIQPMGTPSQADRNTLETVVAELNQLTNGQVSLQIVQENPNVQIYFVPEAEFSRYEPNYVPRNLGFFWARWNNSGIYNSRILISTTGVSQTERSHLIREELTQSLGLMRDSYRYEDSIFQQRWTQTNQFSDIDRAIIQLLYRPDIRPGMSRAEVLSQLSR